MSLLINDNESVAHLSLLNIINVSLFLIDLHETVELIHHQEM